MDAPATDNRPKGDSCRVDFVRRVVRYANYLEIRNFPWGDYPPIIDEHAFIYKYLLTVEPVDEGSVVGPRKAVRITATGH